MRPLSAQKPIYLEQGAPRSCGTFVRDTICDLQTTESALSVKIRRKSPSRATINQKGDPPGARILVYENSRGEFDRKARVTTVIGLALYAEREAAVAALESTGQPDRRPCAACGG